MSSSPQSQPSQGSQSSQKGAPNAVTLNALYEKAKYDPRMRTEEDWKKLSNEWDNLVKLLEPADWEAIDADFAKEQWPQSVEYHNLIELGRYEREARERGEPPLWTGEAKREDTDNPVQNAAH